MARVDLGDRKVWTIDGLALQEGTTLASLLRRPASEVRSLGGNELVEGVSAAPCEPDQEVWASGVTYFRSRQEREAESSVADVYARVYEAARPELFFKSVGWRVVGNSEPIRIRRDSDWNVPEPELTLVINSAGEIIGYTAGNDVSSRSIEGENPLYLPQAKTYDGSCAVGPAIVLTDVESMADLPIRLQIVRKGTVAFEGETRTSAMRRTLRELAGYLFRETSFPNGAFLMTGTGIVPPHPFTLEVGDLVRIMVGALRLENPVRQ